MSAEFWACNLWHANRSLLAPSSGRITVDTDRISVKAFSNDCTLSIMMLASYEFRNNAGSSYHAHMDGLVELLKIRGESTVLDQQSRKLFSIFRDRILMYCMMVSKELPFIPQDHPWFFLTLSPTPFAELQTIALKIPELRSTSKRLSRKAQPPRVELERLLELSLALVLSLRRWYSNHARMDTHVGSNMSFNPPDLSMSMMFRWFRTCEITCQDIVQQCLLYLSATSCEEDANELQRKRRCALSDIARSYKIIRHSVSQYERKGDTVFENGIAVPYPALASTGYMLQPLVIASMTDCIDNELRTQVLEQIVELSGAGEVMSRGTAVPTLQRSLLELKGVNPLDLIGWIGRFAG